MAAEEGERNIRRLAPRAEGKQNNSYPGVVAVVKPGKGQKDVAETAVESHIVSGGRHPLQKCRLSIGKDGVGVGKSAALPVGVTEIVERAVDDPAVAEHRAGTGGGVEDALHDLQSVRQPDIVLIGEVDDLSCGKTDGALKICVTADT